MSLHYSRRNFLKQNPLAGLGIIGAGTIAGSLITETVSATPATKPAGISKISDLNLKKLRQSYMEALFGKFLPNMDSLVVDHELGGFMCSVDISTGKQASSKKSAWYEGRGMWTYAFLYNNLEKNPKYLEVARKL